MQKKWGTSSRTFMRAIPWMFLAVACGVALWASNRGLDLTDESYYVMLIVDPSGYLASIHSFALPFHLVFDAFGHSIVALRVFGIALLVVTGAVLGHYLERFYFSSRDGKPAFSLVALGALYSLAYYGALWIQTPSYNLLANAGGALVMAGVLGWYAGREGSRMRDDLIASFLVGFGGMLAAFGKATFAALAGLAVAALLVHMLRKEHRRTVLARAAVAGLSFGIPLVLVFIANGGIVRQLRIIERGMEVLKAGNSLSELPLKTVRELYQTPGILTVTATALVFCLAVASEFDATGKQRPRLHRLVLAICATNLIYLAATVLLGIRATIPFNVMGVPVLSTAIALACYGIVKKIQAERIPARELVPVVALLSLPLAIAFGTANMLVPQAALSLSFVFLAISLVAWRLLPNAAGNVMQAGTMVFAMVLFAWSSSVPYGLPASIWSQTRPVTLPFTPDTLYVDPTTADYVAGLQSLSRRGELRPTTPVIDLSGGGPGTALVLDGWAPFVPWLAHVFPASASVVEVAWGSLTREQQEAAWIVGPVDGAFVHTAPAALLRLQKDRYERMQAPEMQFWGRRRTLEIWKPLPAGKPVDSASN